LHEVRDLRWRATIAGAQDRSPETTAAIREKVAHLGLADRVLFAGTLDENAISALYSSGDIFALASFYEGYGMAFAEAMAHGLPIVASGEGAVRDTVPKEAGFVCAPGDVSAIADALRSMMSNRFLRREKAQAAWERGQKLPTWKETGATIAGVLQREAQ
jgi:glycosyltransferase involved in cell wall biosynthesis